MDWSQNLDFENIGNWPKPAKATVVVLTFALILSLGYFWDTSSLFKSLDTAKNREADLRQLFEQRQSLASNLDQYKSQMKEIERRFSRLLAQLPGKTEVHELLSDISRTGVSSGLEFELFKPETEEPIDFYAELPIQLQVRGRYHEFGNFVSEIATLSRIVTLHDFEIRQHDKESDELVLKAIAKTYRYLDEQEIKDLAQSKKK